ncbi:MAG TPA: DUF2177 family protein [Roseateles sp.]
MTSPSSPRWQWPLAYATTLLVFLAMDAVWLSTATAALYRPAIGHLLAPTVDWVAAALFYVFYLAGLVYFAVAPALAARSSRIALGRGVLLGLLCYGTYDFTNQATMQGWPWLVTVVDLAWGGTVTGVSCWAAAAVTLKLLRHSR